MFWVRSARVLAPKPWVGPSPCMPLFRRHRPTPSRLLARAPRPASHALLSTRQNAHAFNQPLSFDTSKVTDMYAMFKVRSARALAPKP